MSGWTDFRKHVSHQAKRFRKHVQEEAERFKNWYDKHGPQEVKISTSSTDDGKTWNPEISVYQEPGYSGVTTHTPRNNGSTKPAAYSRSTAATAKDIAQGGMTKDEVIEFNMKHPNETANIGG